MPERWFILKMISMKQKDDSIKVFQSTPNFSNLFSSVEYILAILSALQFFFFFFFYLRNADFSQADLKNTKCLCFMIESEWAWFYSCL